MTMPIITDPKDEVTPKNTFPIILQLSILCVVMTVMFGALWLHSKNVAATDDRDVEIFKTIPLDSASTANLIDSIEAVSIRAEAAYVWDVKGERALYRKNESTSLPLASITKLMTALLVHELYPEDARVTVPTSAIRQDGDSGLSAGDVLTVAELTEFALVASSNDAAYTLATIVGAELGDRDPVDQFVAAMNIRSQEMGLSSIKFNNMTGLDESRSVSGGIGSAKDASFLMEYIIETHPEILAPTLQSASRIYNDDGAFYDITNTNPTLNEVPNIMGSKTGYTDLAGGNLTIAFNLGLDRPIVVTVLGSTRDQRFSDVLTLVSAVQSTVKQQTYE